MAVIEPKGERGDPKPLLLGIGLLVLVVLIVGGLIYWFFMPARPRTITLSGEQARQAPAAPQQAPPPGPPFPPSPPTSQATDPGPTLISLDLKNATASEAFTALAKQGNANIVVPGGAGGGGGVQGFLAALTAKRFDVSISNQPFWLAMKQLGETTGLHPYAEYNKPDQITLSGGAATTRPTVPAGSCLLVLNRVVSTFGADVVTSERTRSRELSVWMTLYVEPRLKPYRISRIAVIETAVDENGASLVRKPETWDDRNGGGNRSKWSSDVECKLQFPANAGQRIARLKGYASVAVAGEPQTIKVKDPLKLRNSDQKVDGTLLRIVQVRKTGAQNYEIRMQGDANSPVFKDYENFQTIAALLDAGGKEIGQRGGAWWGGGGRNFFEFGINIHSADSNAEPAELAITLPTNVREIRVPFEFTDLLLPH